MKSRGTAYIATSTHLRIQLLVSTQGHATSSNMPVRRASEAARLCRLPASHSLLAAFTPAVGCPELSSRQDCGCYTSSCLLTGADRARAVTPDACERGWALCKPLPGQLSAFMLCHYPPSTTYTVQ